MAEEAVGKRAVPAFGCFAWRWCMAPVNLAAGCGGSSVHQRRVAQDVASHGNPPQGGRFISPCGPTTAGRRPSARARISASAGPDGGSPAGGVGRDRPGRFSWAATVNASNVTRTSRSWHHDRAQHGQESCGDEYSYKKVLVTLAKSTAKYPSQQGKGGLANPNLAPGATASLVRVTFT